MSRPVILSCKLDEVDFPIGKVISSCKLDEVDFRLGSASFALPGHSLSVALLSRGESQVLEWDWMSSTPTKIVVTPCDMAMPNVQSQIQPRPSGLPESKTVFLRKRLELDAETGSLAVITRARRHYLAVRSGLNPVRVTRGSPNPFGIPAKFQPNGI
ncbi:hypothetical protein K438DRAFT_1771299 [Mycena galopus ATCC 62051]|nr:hypothetical protein K438DRAFT_1771299 [Mycena galopus ATCC 62051]